MEVAGRTIEEAKESALDQLGVAEGDAEVVVLTEPKTGLFGRVRGEARVRARVRPVGPRPKRTRRPREDRSRGGGGTGRSERSGPPRTVAEAGEGSAPGPTRDESGSTAGEQTPSEQSTTGGSGRSRSARRRRSRSGARPPEETGGVDGSPTPEDGGDRRRAGSAVRNGSSGEEEIGMAEGMTLQEQAEAARDFLEGLLGEYGFEAAVDTRVIDDETVEIAASGSDLGLLVGPRGSTLAALQDVTRTVVQRQFPTKTDRILVDVAGYRERRAAALQRFSQQVASEVIESGAERALEPMSPADRKVVHDSINATEGVQTRSEGEDPTRYIVIFPAD